MVIVIGDGTPTTYVDDEGEPNPCEATVSIMLQRSRHAVLGDAASEVARVAALIARIEILEASGPEDAGGRVLDLLIGFNHAQARLLLRDVALPRHAAAPCGGCFTVGRRCDAPIESLKVPVQDEAARATLAGNQADERRDRVTSGSLGAAHRASLAGPLGERDRLYS